MHTYRSGNEPAADLIALRLFFFFYAVRIRYFLLLQKATLELFESLEKPTLDYHNHLGSGALVTDSAGNEIFRITYTEYGEIDLANSGKYNPDKQEIEHHIEAALIAITAVKYTGQEYDPETGFYYYNARYYDPQLGVFTTPDTVFDSAAGVFGFNRHMYVAGNPVMYSDPTGHFLDALANWWSDNVYKPARDWYDQKIGSPIRSRIGDKAFNTLAGLSGGLVPGYDVLQAHNAGGWGNVGLNQIGQGITGLINYFGCHGCYVNLSYTYSDGFGFGIGWGTYEGNVGANVGLMYRERGIFAGLNSTIGLGARNGSGAMTGLNFVFNMNKGAFGAFVTFGGNDGVFAGGVSAGLICGGNSCEDVYAGYSAADYGDIGGFDIHHSYYTRGDGPENASRLQKVAAHGSELTFGYDAPTNTLKGFFLGERGVLGHLGQILGLKATSVVHDHRVVRDRLTDPNSRDGFFRSMPSTFVVGQMLSHNSYRLNAGYGNFINGLSR